MRILHVIDSGGLYGAERMLLGLAGDCRRRGHEVVIGTIVGPEDQGDALGEAARARGLTHVAFFMRDGPGIGGFRPVLDFAREQRIDVIHSHGYKANVLTASAPLRLRSGASICTLHGWTSTRAFSRLALYEWVERRALVRFERVVAVSRRIQKQLRGALRSAAIVIPNGIAIPPRGSAGEAPSRDRDPVQGPVTARILAAGRLAPEKGFDILISAVGILKERGILVDVTVAGEGPMRAHLQKQIKDADLSDQVQLVGYLADLEPLYRQCDIFVLCSRTEGLPLVLLEAMIRGIPVIAAPVGDVPEVVEQGSCAWLLDALDAVSLADAVVSVAGDVSGATAQRARAAVKRVEQCYSLDRMSLEYCRAYQSAIEAWELKRQKRRRWAKQ